MISFKAQFQNYSTRRFLGPQMSVNLDIPSLRRVASHVIDAFNFLPVSSLIVVPGLSDLCQGGEALALGPSTCSLPVRVLPCLLPHAFLSLQGSVLFFKVWASGLHIFKCMEGSGFFAGSTLWAQGPAWMAEVSADTGFVDSSPTVAREGEGGCLLRAPGTTPW